MGNEHHANYDKEEIRDRESLDPLKRRRVKNLTNAELTRKRARDRHAQQVRRVKLAQHIENLEKQIASHEDRHNEAFKKNQELEATLADLKAQFVIRTRTIEKPDTQLQATEIPAQQLQRDYTGAARIHEIQTPSVPIVAHIPPSIGDTSREIVDIHLPIQPIGVDESYASQASVKSTNRLPTVVQKQYLGTDSLNTPPTSSLDDSAVEQAGPHQTYFTSRGEQAGSTTSFEPLTPSSNSDHQVTILSSNCWQNQPSVYAWQIPTKISTPTNIVDENVLGIIQARRHLARTNNLSGEALIGPVMPDLNVLFGRASSEKAHPLIAVLTATYHQLAGTIPEFHNRVAGFLATYRLYQWMIDPCKTTYDRLFEWQAPRPSQLLVGHPAWMDTPAWGKFRDMIIENQELYGTFEFQFDYISSIILHWPFDPMDAVCADNDKLIHSPLLINHLNDQANIYMSYTFGQKYPEFANVCRFEEVPEGDKSNS